MITVFDRAPAKSLYKVRRKKRSAQFFPLLHFIPLPASQPHTLSPSQSICLPRSTLGSSAAFVLPLSRSIPSNSSNTATYHGTRLREHSGTGAADMERPKTSYLVHGTEGRGLMFRTADLTRNSSYFRTIGETRVALERSLSRKRRLLLLRQRPWTGSSKCTLLPGHENELVVERTADLRLFLLFRVGGMVIKVRQGGAKSSDDD